jgi:hypothetical protein
MTATPLCCAVRLYSTAFRKEADNHQRTAKVCGKGSPTVMSDSPSNPQNVLDTAQGPDGETLTLHAVPGGFEIHAGGQLYISSALRRSERELTNVGMVALRDRNDITVLIAGLGMGHLLAAVLENPRVVRVDVVEHSSAIINWNRSHFAALHRAPPLDDPRVHVHQMGLSAYLRAFRYKALPTVQLEDSGYLAILLDLDEGPSHLLRAKNADLYSEDGLTDLEETLRPGGVLALWSQAREVAFIEQLKGRFQNIAEIVIPVEVPGSPGLDYLYRARRRPPVHRTRAQA